MLFLFKEINLITVFCVFTKNRFFLLLPLLKKYLLMIIIIAHLARHKLCFHLRFWWRINSNGSNAKMSWFDWLIWYLYKTVRPFYVRFADGFYCLLLCQAVCGSDCPLTAAKTSISVCDHSCDDSFVSAGVMSALQETNPHNLVLNNTKEGEQGGTTQMLCITGSQRQR